MFHVPDMYKLSWISTNCGWHNGWSHRWWRGSHSLFYYHLFFPPFSGKHQDSCTLPPPPQMRHFPPFATAATHSAGSDWFLEEPIGANTVLSSGEKWWEMLPPHQVIFPTIYFRPWCWLQSVPGWVAHHFGNPPGTDWSQHHVWWQQIIPLSWHLQLFTTAAKHPGFPISLALSLFGLLGGQSGAFTSWGGEIRGAGVETEETPSPTMRFMEGVGRNGGIWKLEV